MFVNRGGGGGGGGRNLETVFKKKHTHKDVDLVDQTTNATPAKKKNG